MAKKFLLTILFLIIAIFFIFVFVSLDNKQIAEIQKAILPNSDMGLIDSESLIEDAGIEYKEFLDIENNFSIEVPSNWLRTEKNTAKNSDSKYSIKNILTLQPTILNGYSELLINKGSDSDGIENIIVSVLEEGANEGWNVKILNNDKKGSFDLKYEKENFIPIVSKERILFLGENKFISIAFVFFEKDLAKLEETASYILDSVKTIESVPIDRI